MDRKTKAWGSHSKWWNRIEILILSSRSSFLTSLILVNASGSHIDLVTTWICETTWIFPLGYLLCQEQSPAWSCPPVVGRGEGPLSPWPQGLPQWLGLLHLHSEKPLCHWWPPSPPFLDTMGVGEEEVLPEVLLPLWRRKSNFPLSF